MELIKYAILKKKELIIVMTEDYSETFEEKDVNFQFSYPIGEIDKLTGKEKIGDYISGGSEDRKYSIEEVENEINRVESLKENGSIVVFEDEELTVKEILAFFYIPMTTSSHWCSVLKKEISKRFYIKNISMRYKHLQNRRKGGKEK